MSKTLTPGALRAIARGLDDRKIALNKRAAGLDDREAELERLKHEHVGQYLEVFGSDPATMLERYKRALRARNDAEAAAQEMATAYADAAARADLLQTRLEDALRRSDNFRIDSESRAGLLADAHAALDGWRKAFIGMSAAALVMSGLFGLSFAGLL